MGWAERTNKNPDKGKLKPGKVYRKKRLDIADYANLETSLATPLAVLSALSIKAKRRNNP
jgi:hypothetical protein